MKTIKKGSKGEEVKVLQHLLNVDGYKLAIDGDFGAKTEAAVKLFQADKGLEADGIVGAATWAVLGCVGNATNSDKCVDPSVLYLPLKVHVSHMEGRTIKYLAIHYTAGSSSEPGKARAVRNVFVSRSASADFAVDDAEMVQFNPDLRNYYCWAVGDKKAAGTLDDANNRNTISIEICSTLRKGTNAAVPNHEGWSFTEAAINNAVKLAKMLMAKYDIPIERVVRHFNISGKLCPGIIGWNTGFIYTTDGRKTSQRNTVEAWEEFKERLK